MAPPPTCIWPNAWAGADLAGHAFNFSADNPISVLDLVDRILRLMNSPLRPHVLGEARHEIKHQYLSAARARQMLDWSPHYALDDALRKTIAWYEDFLANPEQSHDRAA